MDNFETIRAMSIRLIVRRVAGLQHVVRFVNAIVNGAQDGVLAVKTGQGIRNARITRKSGRRM